MSFSSGEFFMFVIAFAVALSGGFAWVVSRIDQKHDKLTEKIDKIFSILGDKVVKNEDCNDRRTNCPCKIELALGEKSKLRR